MSNPDAEVCWFRNGEPLSPQDGREIQMNGKIRTLIIQSADYYDSGTYSCQSAEDVAVFQVDITGDRKPTIQICICQPHLVFVFLLSPLLIHYFFPFLRSNTCINIHHHDGEHLCVTTNQINLFSTHNVCCFSFCSTFLTFPQTFGVHLLPRHDILI